MPYEIQSPMEGPLNSQSPHMWKVEIEADHFQVRMATLKYLTRLTPRKCPNLQSIKTYDRLSSPSNKHR